MFWNLYSIYTLVTTLLNVLRYTSSSPLNSIDYVNSNDHSKFNNISDESLLVYDTLPIIPTSIDSSSPPSSVLLPTSPTSLSISSTLPNDEEEETLRLQLALALQIDSELNKAMNLENVASESIQQANLLNKEANEAKYRAQIAEHMLNSLKQLWNIINSNDDDDDDNTSYEKRGFIKVPKINQDYLLDEKVGGQLIDDNREKRNQEHRERHHHQQRYYNMKKRRNLYSIPDYPNHEDDADDNDDKNMILNDSELTIEKLHRTKQLTLEKIRLLILRQLIKQQREAEEEEEQEQEQEQEQEKDKGRTGHEQQRDLHHYDHPHGNNNNDNHYDDLQFDRNDIPLQMMNPYPNLYDSLQTWKEKDNDDDDDDSNGINIDMNERNRHGIIKHHPWKSLSHLNSLDKDDSIVFR
ncbi:unnamed protein product [Schistosoma rodhaini]|uniref:Myb domain-containing protein n=1 Tax=Schistosoma rodhaini TaxID=6188 RepID=A0A183QUF5_9TREM|nr:unnamed protein product [Schistosoma rodhaini]